MADNQLRLPTHLEPNGPTAYCVHFGTTTIECLVVWTDICRSLGWSLVYRNTAISSDLLDHRLGGKIDCRIAGVFLDGSGNSPLG